jgi:RsiW-degrading membrane proteinase PrsW (M82 family)
MSINAMTNAAIGRRRDFEPANEVPKNLTEIAQAANAVPALAPGVQPAGAPRAAAPPSVVNTALQTLTTYIPTEVLTLYVATVAALDSSIIPKNGPHNWLPFFIFLVGTPLIAWLAFATKVKSAGRPIPWNPSTWPMWEMSAAAIAFAVWAFALPDTPFLQFEKWYSKPIAGLAVTVVSYGLGALGPLMQRPLSAGPSVSGG